MYTFQDFQRLKILQIKPADEINNEIEEQSELYIKREDIFEAATTVGPDQEVIIAGNTNASSSVTNKSVQMPTNQTLLAAADYEIVIREGKETITLFPETLHKLFNSIPPHTSSSADTTRRQQFLHVTTAPPVPQPPPADWRDDIDRKYPDILDSNELDVDDTEEVGSVEAITNNFLENLEEYDDYRDVRKIYSR